MAASVAQFGCSNKPQRQLDRFAVLSQLDREEVDRICRQKGHHFRDVKLPPGKTVRCFGWQILMGNVTCDAVVHRSGGAFTASAYCQARQRLPLEVLQEVSDRIVRQAIAMFCRRRAGGKEHLWCGHRTFLMDGSGATLADTEEVRTYFGISGNCKPGCSYPTAHLLLMVGAGGVGIDCFCSPLRTGDMTHASRMHMHLRAGDVLIGDRQFSGVAHLHSLGTQRLHGVFPLHHSRKIAWGKHGNHGINGRRFVKTLGWRDQLVEYRKPSVRPKWMSKQAFDAMPPWTLVREVQRKVKVGGGSGGGGGGARRTVTLVTTLIDPKKYPARALVKLLGARWSIELHLRSLKSTMGGEQLHCQTVDGVKKELLMHLIVYNLVRLLMGQAAKKQKVPVDRISFADALMRLRYGTIESDDDDNVWVDLKINPLRSGRIEPRVLKRRPKSFAWMSKPRAQLRRQLLQQRRKLAA